MITEDMELICTSCDGMGQERRKITHPAANVAGWWRESPMSDWWRRPCARCNGTGFVPSGTSVPSVKEMADGRMKAT